MVELPAWNCQHGILENAMSQGAEFVPRSSLGATSDDSVDGRGSGLTCGTLAVASPVTGPSVCIQ